MFKRIHINCDEATTICDKNQYGEATFFEKIQLSLHLFMCKICAKYVKQNRKLSQVFKIKSSDCKDENHCLSNVDKESLKKQLEEFNV